MMHQSQSHLLEEFVSLELLGSGCFGNVYKATRHDGSCVALKHMHAGDKAQREASLSARLAHPNIIATISWHQLADGTVALVQELADGGDLFDYIRQLRGIKGYEGDAMCEKSIFAQLAEAVNYLHREARVSHRDIKPENCVLLRDGTVKLLDFGLSERRRYVQYNIGTDLYAAPEILQQPGRRDARRPGLVDGFAADVFSLGVMLYALLMGELPWDRADPANDEYRYACIAAASARLSGFRLNKHLSARNSAFVERLLDHGLPGAVFSRDPAAMGFTPQLCRLLDAMLHPNPRRRPDTEQVCLNCTWYDCFLSVR